MKAHHVKVTRREFVRRQLLLQPQLSRPRAPVRLPERMIGSSWVSLALAAWDEAT